MAKDLNGKKYAFRLTTEEDVIRFDELYKASGAGSVSNFIRHLLFNKPFRVITISKEQSEIAAEITRCVVLIRRIGGLYNQAVKALNSYHTEVKAALLVQKIEKYQAAILEAEKRIIALAETLNHMK